MVIQRWENMLRKFRTRCGKMNKNPFNFSISFHIEGVFIDFSTVRSWPLHFGSLGHNFYYYTQHFQDLGIATAAWSRGDSARGSCRGLEYSPGFSGNFSRNNK
jgi:hypothetical protein